MHLRYDEGEVRASNTNISQFTVCKVLKLKKGLPLSLSSLKVAHQILNHVRMLSRLSGIYGDYNLVCQGVE